MPFFYGFDWTYLVLVLPCVILSLWASSNVNGTFKRYSKQYAARGITGAQAAQRVLSANGVTGVRIQRVSGHLSDHFDPKTNIIRLSDSVYDSTSTAAIGVACHEAGHAVQYAVGYAPIKLRAAIIPITNIGSKLAMPLILLGLLLSFGETVSFTFVIINFIQFFFIVKTGDIIAEPICFFGLCPDKRQHSSAGNTLIRHPLFKILHSIQKRYRAKTMHMGIINFLSFYTFHAITLLFLRVFCFVISLY